MADAALLAAWVAGRSVARGIAPPVADHGGWRVDTGTEAEVCRWVFAAPGAGLLGLADTIAAPRHWLKWCAAPDAVALPPRWRPEPLCWFMQATEPPPPAPPPPPGYTMATERSSAGAGDTVTVRILASDGTLAASGYGGETEAAFVYDRIVTDAAHRRRGLGGAVMAALHAARRRPDRPQLLVATDAGRALYTRLGWTVLSPYASATIPALPLAPSPG